MVNKYLTRFLLPYQMKTMTTTRIAPRDENGHPAMVGVDSTDPTKVVVVKVDATTGAIVAKSI